MCFFMLPSLMQRSLARREDHAVGIESVATASDESRAGEAVVGSTEAACDASSKREPKRVQRRATNRNDGRLATIASIYDLG